MYRMNIRIYSVATYLPNEISEYIRITEIARIQIQIIFEGHFIRILEYLYSSLIEGFF